MAPMNLQGDVSGQMGYLSHHGVNPLVYFRRSNHYNGGHGGERSEEGEKPPVVAEDVPDRRHLSSGGRTH